MLAFLVLSIISIVSILTLTFNFKTIHDATLTINQKDSWEKFFDYDNVLFSFKEYTEGTSGTPQGHILSMNEEDKNRELILGLFEEGGEVTDEVLREYADYNSEKYEKMVEKICEKLKFTSLRFHRLDDMIKSIGISPCKLCTYCFNGKE